MNTKAIVILAVVGLMVFFSQPVCAASKSSKDVDKKEATSESVQPTVSEEARALKNFERIVDDFSKYFATNPKFVSKEADSERYSFYTAKIIYTIHQQVLKNVSFDVRKTDSLVSPFAGYIDVEFIRKNNVNCGDVFFRSSPPGPVGSPTGPIGYSNIHIALNRANEDSCFKSLTSTTDRYEFAYQNSRWVLKSIKSIRDKRISQNDFMTAVLGIKESAYNFKFITEPAGLDFNKKWFVLVKPYVD
jgi:hypothetical protein